MKKLLKRLFLLASLILMPFLMTVVLADPPGPPAPGGSPVSGGGTPVGAPIDNGIFILLILGVLYGTYKLYEFRKTKTQEALK